MNDNDRFQALLSELKLDGRYETAAEFECVAGEFPSAPRNRLDGNKQRITVWCSNAYLGMEQPPAVLDLMHRTIDRRRNGRHARYFDINRRLVPPEGKPADMHREEADLISTFGRSSNLAGVGTLEAALLSTGAVK